MNKEFVVLCTVPKINLAKKIAESLVTKKLAACCNILPQVTSIYAWKGDIYHDDEVVMLIKTSGEKYSRLEARIKSLHSYEVPEIIALEIKKGSAEYINWIHQVVSDE